jgi:hypothetical protein
MADSSSSPSTPSPARSGPVPVRERRRTHPTRASRLALGAAVAVLPAAQRQRYTLEFLAELHDVRRGAQLRHALGLLVHAWELRLALGPNQPTPRGASVMRKSMRCTLHVHHYVKRHNGEVYPALRYFECTRCGRVKDIPRLSTGVW